MGTSPLGPKSTTAVLSFSEPPPPGTPAHQYINAEPSTGVRKRNFPSVKHEIIVENARALPDEDKPTLDTAAFQLFNRPSRYKTFADDAEIEREYYPESIEILKEITGASRVVMFDHTIRRRRPGEVDDSPQKRQPVANAHVDQTTTSSIARVHRHLPPSDASSLLKRRFQIINLWRPINHPAIDWPLGLCDYKSVDVEKDTFPVALIYPNREPGQTMGIAYNPNQKWKYFHGMTTDEIILIKCFDSIDDPKIARFAPHTGFEDPNTPPGTPLRESIELRALLFYDN